MNKKRGDAMEDKKSVSFIAFEAEMARQERTIKRLWLVSIAAVVGLVGTNLAWIIKAVM